MISTLRKIPWYMADDITIKQRHSVYETCVKMIGILVGKLERRVRDNAEAERLTPQLLHRLVTVAMLCPGFSVVQKHNIATIAGLSETQSREFNQPRFPDSWRHQWTLVPKAGMPIDVLEVRFRHPAHYALPPFLLHVLMTNVFVIAVVYLPHPDRD